MKPSFVETLRTLQASNGYKFVNREKQRRTLAIVQTMLDAVLVEIEAIVKDPDQKAELRRCVREHAAPNGIQHELKAMFGRPILALEPDEVEHGPAEP